MKHLINLEVLKAVKSFSPGSDPTAATKQAHSEPKDCFANVDHIKSINENLQCIIDNQKFLYERFQILSSTVNVIAKAQTEVKTSTTSSTNSSTQTPSTASAPPGPTVNPTVPPPRYDYSTPPPKYTFPPPPPPPPPPTPPAPPSPRFPLPSDPSAQARPMPKRSLLGAPPPHRRSLLGSPPSLKRTPGLPQPLSVFFCNLYRKPRKLEKKVPPPPVKTKHVQKSYSTKIFSNLSKDFPECRTEEIRSHFTSISAQVIISEILTEVIDDLTNTALNTAENSNPTVNTSSHTDNNPDKTNTETVTSPSKNAPSSNTKESELADEIPNETEILENTEILLNESIISLDSSAITNSLGDPTSSLHELSSSHLSLNCWVPTSQAAQALTLQNTVFR